MKRGTFIYCLFILGVVLTSGCGEVESTGTPYIYCLDELSFLFPQELVKRFEAKETEIQLSDGTISSTVARSYLALYENFRFDLDIFVDCYLQEDELFCDSTYTQHDKFILSMEGQFGYDQNSGIKLIPICYPGNACVELNIETLTGSGVLRVDRASEDYWEDISIDYQYSLQCDVGFNPLTDEYFPIGKKASIAIELPLKNGERFKAFFGD